MLLLRGCASDIISTFPGGTPENAAKMATPPPTKTKGKGIKIQREESAFPADQHHPASQYRQDDRRWFRDTGNSGLNPPRPVLHALAG
jgi:hypothetical protein